MQHNRQGESERHRFWSDGRPVALLASGANGYLLLAWIRMIMISWQGSYVSVVGYFHVFLVTIAAMLLSYSALRFRDSWHAGGINGLVSIGFLALLLLAPGIDID